MSPQRMPIPIWQVDSFTEKPFAGNPAAVCLLDHFPDERWLQNVAAEMNLSETAFLVPTGTANEFQLRWFTPTVEVELCGHATLAAAHVLYQQGHVDSLQPTRFQTNSGELTCERHGDMITLDFPSTPPTEPIDDQTAALVLLALGVEATHIARTCYDIFVVVDGPHAIVGMQPNFERLGELDARGYIVTAKSDDDEYDFISRFFGPRYGINEDPVTGSAHCALAPYWASKLGRNPLIGYQASRRGGTVHTEVVEDRVKLSGYAVTVLEAKIFVRR